MDLPDGSLFGFHNAGQTLWATQLWMTANALLLGAIALWILSRRKWPGQITAWLLVLYPIGRFIIEEFRGDSVRGLWFGGFLSTSQLISLVILPFGLFLLWRGHRKHAAERTPA
jgi:prolipoprotein diacylglyceryltransferase